MLHKASNLLHPDSSCFTLKRLIRSHNQCRFHSAIPLHNPSNQQTHPLQAPIAETLPFAIIPQEGKLSTNPMVKRTTTRGYILVSPQTTPPDLNKTLPGENILQRKTKARHKKTCSVSTQCYTHTPPPPRLLPFLYPG